MTLKKVYDLKKKILGKGYDDEGTYLNRTITNDSGCYHYEGDEKHSRILLEEWGLQECKAAATPFYEEMNKEDSDEEEELKADRARSTRRAIARINYMAQDRPDLGFAANMLSRQMARPRKGDELLLKRVVRYLVSHPKCELLYRWQVQPEEVTAHG